MLPFAICTVEDFEGHENKKDEKVLCAIICAIILLYKDSFNTLYRHLLSCNLDTTTGNSARPNLHAVDDHVSPNSEFLELASH